MSEPQKTQQLERNLYRGRRLIDAVRLLPWLGLMLFILPALLAPDDPSHAGSSALRLLYFIAAWLLMIGLAFIIARSLGQQDRKPPQYRAEEDLAVPDEPDEPAEPDGHIRHTAPKW